MTSAGTVSREKKKFAKDDWEADLAALPVDKRHFSVFMVPKRCRYRDVNRLVMNYLVTQGYQDAAEKFELEAGMNENESANPSPALVTTSLTERARIRSALQNGDVELAIALVNDINPQILDGNPGLYFHLQKQKLIEIIRSGNTADALQFAQQELAPRGEENPELLEELEEVMTLFALDPKGQYGAALLDPAQRQKTANELNAAILEAQHQPAELKFPILIKMLVWAQSQLSEKAIFPKIRNLLGAELEEDHTS